MFLMEKKLETISLQKVIGSSSLTIMKVQSVTKSSDETSLKLPRQMFINYQAQVKVRWCRVFAVKRG